MPDYIEVDGKLTPTMSRVGDLYSWAYAWRTQDAEDEDDQPEFDLSGVRETQRAEFDRALRADREVQSRFWSKVARPDEAECWLWTGNISPKGYGMAKIRQVNRGAHIWAYEWLVGPVPDGLELDHLCRVRHCVNPRHLEAVTHRENMLRGVRAVTTPTAKRFCPRRHPLIEGNLVPATAKRRARQCLTCSQEIAVEYRARKKANDV